MNFFVRKIINYFFPNNSIFFYNIYILLYKMKKNENLRYNQKEVDLVLKSIAEHHGINY
jgi:hypothetical protein